MKAFKLVLFLLLGLCASSMAAVMRQMIGDRMGSIGDDDTAFGKELAIRQSSPPATLQRYELVCALDRVNTPWAPDATAAYLTHEYCSSWYECQPDGTKRQIRLLINEQDEIRMHWCRDWCDCMTIDDPQLHYAQNFGCPSPSGNTIHGTYGSVSRDTDSAEPPSDDGLVMEAFEGPPRED